MRTLKTLKLTAIAAIALAGATYASSASAENVQIGYGANVTINVCGGCGPVRSVAPVAPRAYAPVRPAAPKPRPVVRRQQPVAPVPVSAPATASGQLECMDGSNVGGWKVVWIKGDKHLNSRCYGSINASDLAAAGQMAEQGYTDLRVPFSTTKCPSGVASIPTKVDQRNREILIDAWLKSCRDGSFRTFALK